MGRFLGFQRWLLAALAAAHLAWGIPAIAATDDCAGGMCECGNSVCCGECGGGDCNACSLLGSGPAGCFCGSLVTPLGGCASGYEMFWFRAGFMALRRDGVAVPPLVTTSSQADGAALGQPTTSILAGNQTVGNDWRTGFHMEFGFWLNSQTGWAVTTDYFNGGRDAYGFKFGPDDGVLLGRPYFDTETNVESALIFNDPGVISGSVSGSVFDDFQGAGLSMQKRVLSRGSACTSTGGAQLSVLGGYRYYHHDSLIFMHQDYNVVDGDILPNPLPDGLQVFGSEKFAGRNEFHGAEVGFQGRIQRRRWWCEGLAAVAVGGSERVVFVEGSTLFVDPPPATNIPPNVDGGVLLTSTETNFGRYTDNKFQAIPRFRIGAGWQLNEWLGLRAGYNLVIWDIVQAVDHLPPNLEVDPRNIPEVQGGGAAPAFPGIRETTMVSHGLDLGLELSF